MNAIKFLQQLCIHTQSQTHIDTNTTTHTQTHMQPASLWLKTSNANNIFGAT